jgi:hypothetical protein
MSKILVKPIALHQCQNPLKLTYEQCVSPEWQHTFIITETQEELKQIN